MSKKNTMYFNYVLALCFLYHLCAAKTGECGENCDENVKITINYEDDSCDDGDLCESQNSNDNSRIRHLKKRIKELGEELRSLYDTKVKLKDSLNECLIDKGDSTAKSIKKRNQTESEEDMIIWWCGVCVIQDLCYTNSGGCDYYEESREDEGEEKEIIEKLEDRLRKLKKEKRKLKKEIDRLTERLEECREGSVESTERTTKKPTAPPKIKKYIIRTKKVSWREADRLCRNEHKYLASIRSQSDQNALGEARKSQGVTTGQLWVGGYRDSQGKFFWKGQTDTPFTYTNWHSTEPSNWSDEDQNCVESSWEENKYMWFIYECDTEYNYACEYFT